MRSRDLFLAVLLSFPAAAEDRCDLEAADRVLFQVENWNDLGRWSDDYAPQCDDGYLAEHVSELVSTWLARNPHELLALKRASEKHPSLGELALRHLDTLMSPEKAAAIRRNASKRCPGEARELCAGVIEALDELDERIRKEKER